MLKYLAIFAVLLGLAVYVSAKDKQTAQDAAQKAAHQNSTVLSAKSNENHTQEYIEDAERNLPSGYGFFRWPYGTTAWAIILTLFAIAEQTKHTAEAAEATRESVGAITQQTSLLKESVAAARLSADAANSQIKVMKQKERAWLSVDFTPVKQLTFGWLDMDTVEIQIENFGFTHALNVQAAGGVVLSAFTDREPDPASKIETFKTQDVVRSGDAGATGSIFLEKRVTEEDIAKDGLKWMILVQGTVSYDDVFGEPHETRFKRYMLIWRLKKTGTSDIYEICESQRWTKTENPEDNRAT